MPENEMWNIAGADVQVLVSSHSTGGRYTILQVKTAGGDGLPAHAHRYEDGFFYVVQGKFQFQIGEEAVPALQGTSIFIPRQTAYTVRNEGPGRGQLLVVATPGGMDLFIRDIGALTRRGVLLSLENLAPILEKHGIALP